MEKLINELNFDKKGLVPAVIQDVETGKVLTLCYMNKEALEKTFETKKVHLFRRSLNRVMMKGEQSGHVQEVAEVFVDCYANSLLFKVKQNVAACHEGYFTCYFRKIDEEGNLVVVEEKVFDPKDVY